MRGDLYRIPSFRGAYGHEQQGSRYAVIVQTDSLFLSTVLIAPTSTSAKPAYFRPVIEINGQPTRVLPEQIRSVDLERLGAFAGRLSVDEMLAVDRALADVFDFLPIS
jgi:mRNA interferase MazF